MNGLILSVCFLIGIVVSIREAGHEREGVCGERSSCSFRRGNANMWEGIAGREVNRCQEQKAWTERPRGLVLILEGCFNSGEVYRGPP